MDKVASKVELRARTLMVDGNRLRVLPDGPDRLEALIALIDGATQSLRLLYYIYLGGNSGDRVKEAVLRAIDRGVAVSLCKRIWRQRRASSARGWSTAAMGLRIAAVKFRGADRWRGPRFAEK